MSHAQILNLLHREADMSSGYGFGFECPHCEGSGLIGGFAGQKDIYAALDAQPMTAADRKKRREFLFGKLASDAEKNRKANSKLPTQRLKAAAQRIKAAERLIAAKGVLAPRAKAKTAEELVANAMALLADEFKTQ